MNLAELEQRMRQESTVAVNIQCDGAGFRVHVRHAQSEGFTCAQGRHSSIAAALDEHFKSTNDLGDLLV